MSPLRQVPALSTVSDNAPHTLRSARASALARSTLLPPPSEIVVERSGIVAAVQREAVDAELPWLDGGLLEDDAAHDTDRIDGEERDTVPGPPMLDGSTDEGPATEPPPTLPGA